MTTSFAERPWLFFVTTPGLAIVTVKVPTSPTPPPR